MKLEIKWLSAMTRIQMLLYVILKSIYNVGQSSVLIFLLCSAAPSANLTASSVACVLHAVVPTAPLEDCARSPFLPSLEGFSAPCMPPEGHASFFGAFSSSESALSL